MMSNSSAQQDREMIPRALLRAMFGLVVIVLLLVAYARLTDRPLEAKPIDGPVAQERVIHIFGTMAGAAKVLDANGTVIADLDPSQGGFIAGIWRSLNHERSKRNADQNAPVRLVQFADGRLALFDDFTGFRVELIGFGADNTAAFARLLKN
jgi:putative photosynthetic complex assembly protein